MIVFGTDGIRGPADAWPIVPEVARRIGAAAARLARAHGEVAVVIGRDPRPSGEALARAVAEGVVGAGGVARDAGVLPTPAVQLAVADGVAPVGVMVTASHNPAADNGFKVLGAKGRKLDDASCRQVEAWLAEEARAGRAVLEDVRARARDGWAARLAALVGDLSPLAGRAIVIDAANGAVAAVRDVVERLAPGATWIGTAGEVNDGVGSEHLDHLARAVIGTAGGFAVDGDGDRCRVVGEDGVEIPGDAVLWGLARDLGARSLVATVMSNGALERQLPGVSVRRVPVGDRHVREGMDAGGAPLGGEESGHVIFGDHPGGDGVLTGLRALAAALRAGPSVSAGFAGFVPLPRKLTKVRVRERVPLDEVGELSRAREAGLAELGPSGRVYVRYSGTEPVVRILVEGEPEAAVAAVSAAVTAAASRALA